MPYPNQGVTGSGQGADTTLQHNPDLTLPNNLDSGKPMPNDAALFDGLSSASRQMTGQPDASPQGGGQDASSAQKTSLAGNPSEADYLAERGYPYQRTDNGLHWAPS
jgi:hypothetical protein